MSFDKNDPRLTAYVLDELEQDERAAFDELIETDPALRTMVDELSNASCAIVRVLGADKGETLSTGQRERIASRITARGGFRIVRTRSIFAAVAALAAIVLFVLQFIEEPGSPAPQEISRLAMTDVKLVEQKLDAPLAPAAEPAQLENANGIVNRANPGESPAPDSSTHLVLPRSQGLQEERDALGYGEQGAANQMGTAGVSGQTPKESAAQDTLGAQTVSVEEARGEFDLKNVGGNVPEEPMDLDAAKSPIPVANGESLKQRYDLNAIAPSPAGTVANGSPQSAPSADVDVYQAYIEPTQSGTDYFYDSSGNGRLAEKGTPLATPQSPGFGGGGFGGGSQAGGGGGFGGIGRNPARARGLGRAGTSEALVELETKLDAPVGAGAINGSGVTSSFNWQDAQQPGSDDLHDFGYLGDDLSSLARTYRSFALVDVNGDGIVEKVPVHTKPDGSSIVTLGQDLFIRDATAESYAPIVENPFVPVSQQPLSTFGLDVDTASYANVRRFLNDGHLPPPNAVRIEEFVNAFQYHYAAPADGRPVAVQGDIAGCPWNADHRLARIAVKAREIPFEEQPPLRLTFLIDVSGSMKDNNKLPLLCESMKALTQKLRPTDQIAIVTYNNTAQRVLPPTPCSSAGSICATIDSLRADGSTNGAGGIELAYAAAKEQFLESGLNRVILATDGDFNVGETENAALVQRIQEHAKSGVFLTVLGFGIDNLKDDRLEGLADKGNGNYFYIDSFAEANKVLVDRMAGTIAVAAKDVKIQVEFNPAKVNAYRLLGYENRALAAQDFNDDRKDAGDLGAGHTVTALYELVPVGASIGAPGVDDLKYQPSPAPPTNDNPESMTVKLRYKQPNANESDRIELPVTDTGMRFENAPDDFRFASAAAVFAMLLHNSQYAGNASLDQVQEIAQVAAGNASDRMEFISLVVSAKTLRSTGGRHFANGDPVDLVLNGIVKWNDGTYRATITTEPKRRSKRYKEGEVFENYTLLSIDPGSQSVRIYSHTHNQEFELRIP